MTKEKIPDEVMLVYMMNSMGAMVGTDTYNKIQDVIDRNPKYFEWEHTYKSIPKEVHEAYLMESQGDLTDLLLNSNDGIGLIEYVKHGIECNLDYSKTFKESMQEFNELMDKKKRSENKIRKKRIAIWDKHYAKYGLEFRG